MSARAMPLPGLIALLAGTVVAGALAAVNPMMALGLAVAGLAVTLLVRVRMGRLGQIGVVVTAVAAILGPNLALPQAPQVFGFRVLIVLLGLGLVGYLALDGRLVIPRGLPRPAALLIGMFAWAALSITWAASPVAALRWTLFLGMMGGLAIAIPLACADRRRAIRLLIVLGVTFAFATAVAVLEIRFGIRLPTSALLGRSRDAAFAATSLFGNQNNFATYLTLTLPYFICLPVVFRDARLVLVGLVGGGVTLIAVLFTGSRSNLVASFLIIAGLLVVLAMDRRNRRRVVPALAVTALALLLVIPSLGGGGLIPLPADAVTKLDLGQLSRQQRSGLGSGAVRASISTEGLNLVQESGGLGVGAGNAETRIESLDNFTGVVNVHNWWLEVLVDLGVVGFAFYVAFYLTLFRGQLRAARRTNDPLVRWLGLSGALALLGFIVGSLGPSSVIHFAPMWITFGLGMLTIVLSRRTT